MRSVKMSYGLTLTGVKYSHVLQQCCICIYVTTIRTNESDDILTFLITTIGLVNSIRTLYTLDQIDYLSQRDPFSQDHAMRCVALCLC